MNDRILVAADGLNMLDDLALVEGDNSRYTIDIHEPCQPPACDIDEQQSWKRMNRGNLSKKQRRK